MRRPGPLLTLLLLAAVACGGGGGSAPAGEKLRSEAEQEAWQAWDEETGGSASEGERTREMEERAADAQAELEASMAEATTDEERLRAYEEFEAERAEINRLGEGESAGDESASDEYAPPP